MSPEDPNFSLPYLQNIVGKLVLKESDKYYTQYQMQMGVTGCKLCYFFVWTSHGYVIDEILFDAEYWNNLKSLFADLYKHLFTIILQVSHIFLLYLLTTLCIFVNKQLVL